MSVGAPRRGHWVARATARLRNLTFAAVALSGLYGCATLPDTAEEMAAPHPQQVDFEGAHGAISDVRSDAIIDRLEGHDGDTDVLQKHLAFEQAINPDSPLVLGNQLTLLQNGPATYEAMFSALRAATDSINIETYIFADDAIGEQFAELLLQRQAASVQVNVIYDGVGTLSTSTAFFDRMREGGINLLEFNPVNPLAGNKGAWLLNNRDHRKLMVVDGHIAFTGGINISSTYSSAPSGGGTDEKEHRTSGWRDTDVRVEGPVVAEFQRLFLATWARQKGEPLAPRNYFPTIAPAGDQIVRVIGSKPDDPQSLIYMTLISAITHAEINVHLTIAYFAPDRQLLKALMDAARRGVDVQLILPSYSDSWALLNLGRSYYARLLRSGVRIYQRHGAVSHAKTATIDGVWSTIGSTNLDWRSFLHNDEVNAMVLGRGFATQMEVMFDEDLAQSDTITLAQWRHRPLLPRLKECVARLMAYWL